MAKPNIDVITMKPYYFLYLPFYYAQEEEFFGFFPNYNITLKRISSSDQETCVKLLNRHTEPGNICFGIADFTKIIQPTHSKCNDLIVLAALVTNTAFWAITPQNPLNDIKNLEDLKSFKKIISYIPGTTSYGLACGILQKKGVKPNSIKVESISDLNNIKNEHNLIIIEPDQEEKILEELTNNFTQKQESKSFALSPNLLNITNYEIDKNINLIQYMLGKSKEFDNLIATSLITHRNVLNDREYKKVAKGILRAVQKSLLHLYYLGKDIDKPNLKGLKQKIRDKIFTIVHEKFPNIDNDKVIEIAFQRAIKDRIFPRVIEITEADWESSVLVSLMAQQEDKEEHKSSSSSLENFSRLAYNSYTSSIRNYQEEYAQQAIKLEIYTPIFQSIPDLEQENKNLTQTKQQLEQDKITLTQTKQQFEKENKNLTETKQQFEKENKNLTETKQQLEYQNKNLTETKQQFEKENKNLTKTNQQLEQDKRNTKISWFFIGLITPVIIGIFIFVFRTVNPNLRDYSVSVESIDGQGIEGVPIEYQLDNKGSFEFLNQETGGHTKFPVFSNTKTIFFRLNGHSEYKNFQKTIELTKYPGSYKIVLQKKITRLSQQQTGTIKLGVRLVWSGTHQGIEGAELRFFDGTSLLGNKKTSDIGYTEFDVPRKSGLTIQVKHPDLRQDGQMIDVQDLSNVTDQSADVYKELSKK